MKPLCLRPWNGFELFDHLGDVRPCCWGRVSCGNINEQSPHEIWEGSGFQYYRERMLEGDLGAICRSECPILQGLYVEEHTTPASNPAEFTASPTGTPSYLRVVPTITCNLRCPMCYQLEDPPPQLPASLEKQLEPWLLGAKELLVLGGEPFLAKETLDWFRECSPERYPSLSLAAITNGLCFGNTGIKELILERRWSWILVSVDAATDAVYARVRGGSFQELVAGLSVLADTRARTERPFEIRLGFMLHRENLDDVTAFVNLCARFNAMPQFTCAFGDWHDGAPANVEDSKRFLAAIDHADRELFLRGFDETVVAGALVRVLEATHTGNIVLARSSLPMVFYFDGTSSADLQLARAVRIAERYNKDLVVVAPPTARVGPFARKVIKATTSTLTWIIHQHLAERSWNGFATSYSRENEASDLTVETKCTLPTPSAAELGRQQKRPLQEVRPLLSEAGIHEAAIVIDCRSAFDLAQLPEDVEGGMVVALTATEDLMREWPNAAAELLKRCVRRISVSLPYWRDRRAISAIEYAQWIADVRQVAAQAGCELIGIPNVCELGLHSDNQQPHFNVVMCDKHGPPPQLSVVSPVLNGGSTIEKFVESLKRQRCAKPFELILVDDGSIDQTLAYLMTLKPNEKVTAVAIITARRSAAHVAGAFTFRAGVARQIGVRQTTTDRIVFLDSDQVVDQDCIAQHDYWGLKGFDVTLGDRRFSVIDFSSPEAAYWRWVGSNSIHLEDMWWSRFYTGNASVSRRALDAAGGFDETLQYWGLDDTDLAFRLWKSGAKCWHTPRAIVYVDPAHPSGGGSTVSDRRRSSWLHMEVMFRKHLDPAVLQGFQFLWR